MAQVKSVPIPLVAYAVVFGVFRAVVVGACLPNAISTDINRDEIRGMPVNSPLHLYHLYHRDRVY